MKIDSFEQRHVIEAAQHFAHQYPDQALEVSHIDSLPGINIYIRNANQIARLLPQGAKILDWGCGFGQMAYLLANRGFQVSACDWGKRPGIPELIDDRINYFSLHHPTTIDGNNQSFDAIVSSGTLEHAQYIFESIKEIRRLLKPNGWFFVFRFPNEWSISEFVAHQSGRWSHSIRMSKTELRFLLRMFSFRIEKIGYDSFLPVTLGRRFQSLRPLRSKYDTPISILDHVLITTPFISRFSTSLYCIAQLNTEYSDIVDGETKI
jgi:2-polyprenyl-3-methyl-5-hydroxy-6-metoxy-1,4-benzoquinol methylase